MDDELEDLVMGLSTELLGTPRDDLAAKVGDALGRLASRLDADRGYVLKAAVDGRSAGEVFEEWWGPDVDRRNTPIPLLPIDAQRFWVRVLRHGEVVHATEVEELHDLCEPAATALQADGVRSILFVPLMARAAPVGFIGFEARRRAVAWDARTVARMRTVGELLVGTIERCHADAERETVAAELAERNSELERSNRELQQFASVVAHDLNQPLVMVRGFLDALAAIAIDHPARGDEAEQYAAAARRSADRMHALMADVLALARAGAPMPEPDPVDLGSVVQDVLADLDPLLTEVGARVEVGPLPTIEGSATQLGQLFQNLIANAAKYRHPDRPPVIDVTSTDSGARVTVSVSDNGIGIPPDGRRAAFEMFTRLDGSTASGTGIGLAVCARVVANHGGRIWIDESPAGGTTVHTALPRRQPA